MHHDDVVRQAVEIVRDTDDFANSQYPERKSDWQYPVRFWTGAVGVNDRLLTRYFG
ncbi:hypothetical protein [Actinophytocola sp.]|uniref:hypothetical protein n=1 Tax=Actinophytocola sp. TaxID=1872138 RepID=UPI002ED678F9